MGDIEDAAKEAVAIAKGEIPAARIYQNGHFYVPETALRQARLDALEEAARMVESGLGEHFTAGHIRALKDKQS